MGSVTSTLAPGVSPVIMPLAEVIDRYTIALLQLQRLKEEPGINLADKVRYYAKGFLLNDVNLRAFIQQLFDINAEIWDTEAKIRTGEADNWPLEKIGKLALEVRDLNRQRCKIKDKIAILENQGFRELKVNYAGAEPCESHKRTKKRKSKIKNTENKVTITKAKAKKVKAAT